MKITSPAFDDMIPTRFTCDGEDVSPPLVISEVPEGAASLALIMDDPDAPGGTFTHWVLWNIVPEDQEITEGGKPEGAMVGRNGFDEVSYRGPCPPSGIHHYHFRVYALGGGLDLQTGATAEQLVARMTGMIIETAELVGRYERR